MGAHTYDDMIRGHQYGFDAGIAAERARVAEAIDCGNVETQIRLAQFLADELGYDGDCDVASRELLEWLAARLGIELSREGTDG